MRKQFGTRLKESTLDSMKLLADHYGVSQADIIEKLIDFLVIQTDDAKHKRGKDIDEITTLANVRNLLQSLY